MSHFSVLVRVPSSVAEPDLESHISEMMEPYNEGTEIEDYLVFHDEEDEIAKLYETGSSHMVRLATGEEVYDKYSEDIPAGSVRLTESYRDKYATLEEFVSNTYGYEGRDPKTNKYGYWTNPNGKWDWWQVGGRWTGHLLIDYDPAKDVDNYRPCGYCNGTGTIPGIITTPAWRKPSPAGHPVIGEGCNSCYGTGYSLVWPTHYKPVGNHIRINSLDLDQLDRVTASNIDEFWDDWQKFCDSGRRQNFSRRDTAVTLGLLKYKHKSELTGDEWQIRPWDTETTPDDKRTDRYDVLEQVTKELVTQRFCNAFYPLTTWARLDASGWVEQGECGLFGISDATPDSIVKFSNGLRSWLSSGDQNDWVVIVDCHI